MPNFDFPEAVGPAINIIFFNLYSSIDKYFSSINIYSILTIGISLKFTSKNIKLLLNLSRLLHISSDLFNKTVDLLDNSKPPI